MLYNAKKSTRLTKGLVAKYKNTSKEEMPLQDSSDEASIDIEFTNPEGHSSEEDLIESDEELESTDLNNTQTTIGEDEELGESDEVPDTNELNEKVPSSNSDEQSKEVPSVESNEQSKEVDESMFKEDSLRMARGKAPLTKSFVAKFKSTQKDISFSEREIEMNSEDNVVSLRDDENISLMPSSQPIASKRNMHPRVLKATHVEESAVKPTPSEGPSKAHKRKCILPAKKEKKMKMPRVVIEDENEVVQVLRTRSSPLKLFSTIKDFQREQRKVVVAMGLK